ncbi:MAG: hypothetical protein Alpg2KO_03810 [Alphaproteobacteria bacterium]
MSKLVQAGAVTVVGAGLALGKAFFLGEEINPSDVGGVDVAALGNNAAAMADGVRAAMSQPPPRLLKAEAISMIAAKASGPVRQIGSRAKQGGGRVTAAQTAKRARSEEYFRDGVIQFDRGKASAAVKSWTRAAEMGHEQAAMRLVKVYQNGERGVLPDRKKVEHYLVMGAGYEHVPAIMMLAEMKEGHHRGTRSAPEAARLYELAAMLGEVEAAFRAGLLYRLGDAGSLPQDAPRAAGLFALAAQEGHAGAMQQLADMQMLMEAGMTPNAELIRQLLQDSLKQEYIPATISYARFLTSDISGDYQDMTEGYAWAAVAWRNKQPGAEIMLRDLKPKLDDQQIATARLRTDQILGQP